MRLATDLVLVHVGIDVRRSRFMLYQKAVEREKSVKNCGIDLL